MIYSQWEKSNNGLIFGVCEGVAKKIGAEPWLVRVLFLLSVLIFGSGIIFYLALAVSLPNETDSAAERKKKFLGVCHRISQKMEIDVGLIRLATVLLALGSLGATVVGYIVLHFVISEENNHISRYQ